MSKDFYITTTLPYVNADPHIGFALEVIQADAVARYHRIRGDTVFFNTGTDEHGQKIWNKAQEAGEDTQQYVDRYAASFGRLKESLNLSYDAFIRTTNPHHKAAAQELWRRCAAEGDIYKKKYTGLYCVGCEKFVTDKDLVNGECPLHPGKKPEEIEEENYFFALSKYQRGLLDYLSREDVVIPEYRRKEAQLFVAQGLEDFSISREKARMPWGIPVPDDETQVMYVWFDALTNYISTLGWPNDSKGNFKRFWEGGETVQFAGKDQVRFQSIMWQAMLMSAGLPTTKKVMYHGFINSGGQKMSKSIGNVISPFDLVEKYGVDATRFFLLKHVHPTEDTDITYERLHEWYTADLVNGLGNQVARIMKLAQTHLSSPITVPEEAHELDQVFLDAFDACDLNTASEVIWGRIREMDEYIQTVQPFKLVKSESETEREEGKRIIEKLVVHLARIATHLEPFMPQTAAKIHESVHSNTMPEALFPRLQ